MSKKNGRKLFSKSDGTSFKEDIQDISEDLKAFFSSLPPRLKKWLSEAEDFVIALEKLEAAIQDGQPADVAIDYVLTFIKGDADELVYEALKQRLSDFIDDIQGYIDEAGEILGEDKFAFVSEALMEISDLNRIEADTTTQIAVYFNKA